MPDGTTSQRNFGTNSTYTDLEFLMPDGTSSQWHLERLYHDDDDDDDDDTDGILSLM
jgi:hypothetical protein